MRMLAPPALPAVSPGLTAGRGLKLDDERRARRHQQVSPGLTAGRGLKHRLKALGNAQVPSIARPHGRARIET